MSHVLVTVSSVHMETRCAGLLVNSLVEPLGRLRELPLPAPPTQGECGPESVCGVEWSGASLVHVHANVVVGEDEELHGSREVVVCQADGPVQITGCTLQLSIGPVGHTPAHPPLSSTATQLAAKVSQSHTPRNSGSGTFSCEGLHCYD